MNIFSWLFGSYCQCEIYDYEKLRCRRMVCE